VTSKLRRPVTLHECVAALGDASARLDLWESWSTGALQTRPDQRIYAVGDPADDIYVLVDGLMAVTTGESPSRVVLILKPPVVWGDVEIVAGKPVRATGLKAIGRARILCFDAAALVSAREHPDFLLWHEHDLAERLCRVLVNGTDTAQNLERRIAQLAAALADRPEVQQAQALATMTGASVKAVQRILRRLAQQPRPQSPPTDDGVVYSMRAP
jgi:CRP-like cAMP-binding protein